MEKNGIFKKVNSITQLYNHAPFVPFGNTGYDPSSCSLQAALLHPSKFFEVLAELHIGKRFVHTEKFRLRNTYFLFSFVKNGTMK